MARLIYPPLAALPFLRTPLTPGERRVLDFFLQQLPDDWEIYIQPHLNGLRPDFVLLHPHVGIAVFEVKDWNLAAMRYFVSGSGDTLALWCEDRNGIQFRLRDNPIEKVLRYKKEILTLYCPRLGIQVGDQPKILSVITAGVILPATTTAKASALFRPFQHQFDLLGGDKAPYHPLVGGDVLDSGQLGAVFPEWSRPRSWFMSPDLADDLRTWLVEPDHAAAQREPLPLNPRQRELATTRTATGYRRIRGPAGCGKSLALAACAAQLSAEGKDVLVVSFNITLLHYLRDLAVRYPEPRRSIIDRITWLHFHDWCKRVCQEAGMEAEYRQLFRGGSRTEGADVEDGPLDELFETEMPELVLNALKEGAELVSRFDAVLVDEGQDFNLTWWNLLRQVLRPAGEMVLAADTTQDLYTRSRRWTDASLENAGFRGGNWFRLEGSYRFPRELVPHLKKFVEDHLPDGDINLPSEVQGDLFEQPVQFRWLQVREAHVVETCVQAVCELPTAGSPAVPWSDITLLVGTHDLGLKCVEALVAPPRNIQVNHVFGIDHTSSKSRKMGFWMGDARVKAATVHSFKGWESRAMVVQIGRARTPGERAAAYVALSRLRRSDRGSFLTVVCSAPELEAYGTTWPVFKRC
jgi:hypothetical protein